MLHTIEHILTDKGSKYAVSGMPATSRTDATSALKQLKKKKKFAKATHNSWALLLADGEPIKHDDGESGASALMLKMLERTQFTNHIIIVTRWYGGVHLGGDRFRHIQTCVNAYIKAQTEKI